MVFNPDLTDRQFSSLRYEERMEALAIAYERLDNRDASTTRWAVFVASVPDSSEASG